MLPRELLYIIADVVHFDTLLNSLIAFNLVHDIEHFLDRRIIKKDVGYEIFYILPNGIKYRNNLPAIEWSDGCKEWRYNGMRHRENDLPAIEWPNGDKEWYLHNKLHRDNNLPAIAYSDGIGLANCIAKMIFQQLNIQMVPKYGIGMANDIERIIFQQLSIRMVLKCGVDKYNCKKQSPALEDSSGRILYSKYFLSKIIRSMIL